MSKTIYSAAVYCRLSTDDEQAGESVSIETQKMMLTHFCHERGFSRTGDGSKPLKQSRFLQNGEINKDPSWEITVKTLYFAVCHTH